MSSEEKKEMRVQSRPVSDASSTTETPASNGLAASNWHPGYRNRFPWMGALGLSGVVICTMINVTILLCSDGVSSSVWPHVVAPHTIVNTIQSVSGLCLALAIAEGVSIAWWRKALKGSSVAQLHQSWSFSTSFSQIVKNFWRLDVIALAALATKLAILDSFLFQNAATTYVAQDPAQAVTLVGTAAQTFPQTGYVVSEGFGAQTDCACFMIGDTYTPTVDAWETSNGYFEEIQPLFSNCNGICYTHVDAIGFEIDCQKSTDHSDYAANALAAYAVHNQTGAGNSTAWTDVPIFNSSFSMSYVDATTNYSRINMNLVYFDSDNPYDESNQNCPGTLTTVQCTLRPALVRYPTTIVNYTNAHINNGISVGGKPLDTSNTGPPPDPAYSYTNKQAEGFQVLSYLETSDRNVQNTTTQLGGIVNAMSQYMSSSATITYTGGSLWALSQKGILAQTMMFGPPNMGSCDCSFRDALSALVSGINQLAFLTATGLIDQDTVPNKPTIGSKATVQGITSNTTSTFDALPSSLEIADVIYYRTLRLYVGLAAMSTAICILLVLPAFWRYGQLGRSVTLGPMEIASAFRAPMLETGDEEVAAGNLQELINKVGHRKVVYGVVEEGPVVAGSAGEMDQSANAAASQSQSKRQSVRLGMGAPTKVRPVSGVWAMSPNPDVTEMPPATPRSPVIKEEDEH